MTTPSTSPLENPQTSPATDPLQGAPTPITEPANIISEWRNYRSFLMRPALPEATKDYASAGRAVMRMLLLDMAVMGALLSAIGIAMAMGLEMPENVNNTLGPSIWAFALVVVAAPLLEELGFRSWLSGHPSVIAAVIICLVGFAGLPFLIDTVIDPDGTMPILMIIGPAIAIVAAPIAAIMLLKKPVPRLFSRGFPVFFWLSSIAFALVHLANYTEGALWILLPLVVPQLVLGTMLGYVRVHYGLLFAMALHALHNGILFSLAMLGKAAGDAAGGTAGVI